MADQAAFTIIDTGGIDGQLVAGDVSCTPVVPYTIAASNVQSFINETGQFIVGLAGVPKFLGGLDFNEPIPTTPTPVRGDYYIFRNGGNRTVDPIDPLIKPGDWAIFSRPGSAAGNWVVLNYSLQNVIASAVPYDPASGDPTNVKAALDLLTDKDVALVASITGTNSRITNQLRFREFYSIGDVADQMGVTINLDGATIGENIRILSNAMPARSMVTLTVGSSTSDEYKLCELDYSTFTLWTTGPTRNFSVVYKKEGGGQYVASFDGGAAKAIEFKETITSGSNASFLTATIGGGYNNGSTPALIATNENAGSNVPLIWANSANGTTKWKVDNGGHTTQDGSSDVGGELNANTSNLGETYNSGSIATLQVYNLNKQGRLIDAYDEEGGRLFFIKNNNGSGNLQVTGDSSQIYSQDKITSGGDMTCLKDMVVGQDMSVANDLTVTGDVKGARITAETGVISYPLGNNTQGTLQLSTNEQTYNDLWLNCSVPGGSSSIKLRSSGWGSFSGGTDSDVSFSNTATIGQRNDGTTHNSATVPALTLKNLSTAYGARTLACIDDLGNDTFQVLSRGEVKIEGARAELTVAGDIHNSGYKIDTSNLNAGIVSANSSTIYTSTTTGNHTVGGTLTVAGTVVTNSTLTVGSVDIGAKITEYQTKITDLETRLAALEAAAVTYTA